MPSKKIKYFLLIFEDIDSGVICIFFFFFFQPYKTAVCSTNITATVPAPTQHCIRSIN